MPRLGAELPRRNVREGAPFLGHAIADCIRRGVVGGLALAAGLAPAAEGAQAMCVSKVTNQPVACPGQPPSPPVVAGLGSTMVLVGPAAPTPKPAKLCHAAWTGAPRTCRVIAIPMLPLPPLSPSQVGDTPPPPPGYGPPR